MHPLSKRLQVIFDLVADGAYVADIGTDHAYLPIALTLSRKAKGVIACDIKEKPLQKANDNIKKIGINSIETRLGDGLTPVLKGEADTVIVAGMGGDVISHILSCCEWIKDKNVTLLLQPMTSAELLRGYLTENLFEIEKEVAVSDKGKVYTVIKAHFCGLEKHYPIGYEFTGCITPDSEDAMLYLKKQHKRISECISQISGVPTKASDTEHFKKILAHIEKIMES